MFQDTIHAEIFVKHSCVCVRITFLCIVYTYAKSKCIAYFSKYYSRVTIKWLRFCSKKNCCITIALISRCKTLHFINTHCTPPLFRNTSYTSSLSHQTFSRLLSIVKILLVRKFFLLLFLIYRPLFYARSFAIFLPEVAYDNIFGSYNPDRFPHIQERINEIHSNHSLPCLLHIQ